MRILGIDPGESCGWAVWDSGEIIASGVWDLRTRRHESHGMRWLHFEQSFRDALRGERAGNGSTLRPGARTGWVDLVAYEEVRRHLGVDAAHAYGGYSTLLQSICLKESVAYTSIPVATVKKFATGKGNASKVDMVVAARAKWKPWKDPSDDEADALWIAECAGSLYGRMDLRDVAAMRVLPATA